MFDTSSRMWSTRGGSPRVAAQAPRQPTTSADDKSLKNAFIACPFPVFTPSHPGAMLSNIILFPDKFNRCT